MSAHVETFLASLKRCLATPDFLHRFYDRFTESSEEVRAKFRKTEFPRQARVLADSLYVLAVAAQGSEEGLAWRELDRLAERHDRAHLDIRPELYDVWLECLIATVRDFDPEINPEIEAAWRQTLTVGIEHMRSRH
jgi:hemoglobin-like flavoprotein